ncbi:hypothetical protein [Shewanella woodyi]|uniref:hypothetical protein n=1 Tax=Shewanella woodyi TaxID=60961 RepID=UPI00374979C1
MQSYIIGGWTQDIHQQAPQEFAVVMYGMITNLPALTAGTVQEPGWSPTSVDAPRTSKANVLWTYGGGGAVPDAMPKSQESINAITECTKKHYWDGVDFDDESQMNISHVIETMRLLKVQCPSKQSSYTFLAGWNYNNPQQSTAGQATNRKVQSIAQADCTNRFILMCYADKMWDMDDIIANVGPAIGRTLDNGVPPKSVILALTPSGLTQENLAYFLKQVTEYDIGGLFIWNFENLMSADLQLIIDTLGINMT